MAGHVLIDQYLGTLARALPADVVDELADGLEEAWRQRLGEGLEPGEAARAAVSEFGTPDLVVGAFVAQSAGRRTARALLASGPIAGAAWGSALLAALAGHWHVPPVAAALFGGALVIVVACLLAAVATRRSYRGTRLGVLGAFGVLTIDVAAIGAVLAARPELVWPVLVAGRCGGCRGSGRHPPRGPVSLRRQARRA